MRSSNLIKTSSPGAPKKVTSRASASALHLGKSACTIPEHDDMFKRNEKLKVRFINRVGTRLEKTLKLRKL